MGIPCDSRSYLEALKAQIKDFYKCYPHPEPLSLPVQGIQAYTRLTTPVVSRLKRGELALARFLCTGLSRRQNLFRDMGDLPILMSAQALAGAYGTEKEERIARRRVAVWREQLEVHDDFPLGLRWQQMEMDKDFHLSRRRINMELVNCCRRLGSGRGLYPTYGLEERRIPEDSAEFIRRLERGITKFYIAWPCPDAAILPKEAILAYTKLVRPAVRRLREGDLALAWFLVFGIPLERDLFLDMGDVCVKAGAEALVAAYGDKETEGRGEAMVQFYFDKLELDEAFVLKRRWENLSLKKTGEQWLDMMYYNIFQRLGFSPDD